MKNCLLIYYTGTYNTRYVTNILKSRLEKEDFNVETYEIDPLNTERLDLTKYDIIGLGYPIYGYNAPWPFLKFILKQKFPKGMKVFIYKNSGETEIANDASSVTVVHKLWFSGAICKNEYHFLMPYNIHFRFDENLVKEMLDMDEKLYDILVYEIVHDIPNMKRYKLFPRFVAFWVKIQFIGGDINSFLYKVNKDKCTHCGLCIKKCPTHNIYENKKGQVAFHHNCLMCMRCSFFCPTAAIDIGFLQGWKVNGRYDFEKIRKIKLDKPYITKDTKGFFKCYIRTYDYINTRHKEIFGE